MISARHLASSLYGLWLLLRWDASGFGYFERNFGGFWRSYFVAFTLAPLYLAHSVAAFDATTAKESMAHHFASEAVAYVLSWTVFPFAMMHVTRLLQRELRFFDYFVAYNWFQLAIGLVLLPILLLADVGLMTPESAVFLNFIILGVFFAYGVFIARHGLDVTLATGVGIVLFDTVLSMIVRQIVDLAG